MRNFDTVQLFTAFAKASCKFLKSMYSHIFRTNTMHMNTVVMVVIAILAFLYGYPGCGFDLLGLGKPLKSQTIIVDPGHGGYDPGAVWGDIYEKDINLMVSKKLKRHLEAQGAKVSLTRKGDYNLVVERLHGIEAKRYDLRKRIDFANSNGDILIIIHVNSTINTEYRGAEVFYHADSERGKALAVAIQQQLRTIPGMTKRIAKTSNCYMLRYSKIPAALVEIGCLNNQQERELLKNSHYLDMIGQKITAGVAKYYMSPEEILREGY